MFALSRTMASGNMDDMMIEIACTRMRFRKLSLGAEEYNGDGFIGGNGGNGYQGIVYIRIPEDQAA